MLAERLKQRRKESGMTLEELGNMIGKAESTIARYESGSIKNLPPVLILELAKALDISPFYLIGWSNNFQDYNDYLNFVESDDEEDEASYDEDSGLEIKEEFTNYSLSNGYPNNDNEFLHTVDDYSMYPTIRYQAIVTVDPNQTPQMGDIVCAHYKSQEYPVLRKYYKKREYTILIPEDLTYSLLIEDAANPIEILGVVTNVSQKI